MISHPHASFFQPPSSSTLLKSGNTTLHQIEPTTRRQTPPRDRGNNTKLVKPRFGVVVHRTPTEDSDLENAKSQAIEKITQENNLVGQAPRIEEVAWLKKRDKMLGKLASLGIWFDSVEGTEYILNNGLLVGQRYIGSVG